MRMNEILTRALKAALHESTNVAVWTRNRDLAMGRLARSASVRASVQVIGRILILSTGPDHESRVVFPKKLEDIRGIFPLVEFMDFEKEDTFDE